MNSFKRFENETGKTALGKTGKILKDFEEWSMENCTPIRQTVDSEFLNETYPKFESGEINKEKAQKLYKDKELDVRKRGFCYKEGNGDRIKGLKEFQDKRKIMREKLEINK